MKNVRLVNGEIMLKEKAKLMVAVMMKTLSGRKGFDYWFDNLDTDIQEEILDLLVGEAEKVLSGEISEMPKYSCFEILAEHLADEENDEE